MSCFTGLRRWEVPIAAAPSSASRISRGTGMRDGPEPKRPSAGIKFSGIFRALVALLMKLGVYPGHVRAQLAPNDLDLVVGLLGPHALEVLLAGAVLRDPLARKVP